MSSGALRRAPWSFWNVEKLDNLLIDLVWEILYKIPGKAVREKPNNSKHSSNIGTSKKLNDNVNYNSHIVDEFEEIDNHQNTLGTQYFNKESTHVNESQLSLDTFTKNTVGIEMVVGRYMEEKQYLSA